MTNDEYDKLRKTFIMILRKHKITRSEILEELSQECIIKFITLKSYNKDFIAIDVLRQYSKYDRTNKMVRDPMLTCSEFNGDIDYKEKREYECKTVSTEGEIKDFWIDHVGKYFNFPKVVIELNTIKSKILKHCSVAYYVNHCAKGRKVCKKISSRKVETLFNM